MSRGWLALLVALAACKGHAHPAPPPGGSQAAARAPAAPHAARERTPAPLPRLPEPAGSGSAATTAAQAFAAEPTDGAWSGATEARIAHRLPGARVACHRTLCRVEVSGSEAELARAIDAMNGLSDLARSVTLGRADADGKPVVRGYLEFERPELQAE
jgi:hypothetical protein